MLLRCLNRLNDLVPGCSVAGDVRYRGIDLYGRDVDPVAVRTRIGLVFQRPNPFPKSIFDNVAFGPRTLGSTATSTTLLSARCGARRCGRR